MAYASGEGASSTDGIDELYEWLMKNGSPNRFKHESRTRYLGRVTSLQLQGKKLTTLVDLSPCQALRVLYLYNNSLCHARELSSLSKLTNLYLENNKLTSTKEFQYLANLVKLYLDGNRISHVSALENCTQLQEIRINDQQLPPGSEFGFAEETISGLGECLATLHISGNCISQLSPYALLWNLKELKVDRNSVESLGEIGALLRNCTLLEILNLSENPVSQKKGYRDFTILNSELLVVLDNKKVPDNQRAFLRARDTRRSLIRSQESRSMSARSSSSYTLGSCNGSVTSSGTRSLGVELEKDEIRSVSSSRASSKLAKQRRRSNNAPDQLSLAVVGFNK